MIVDGIKVTYTSANANGQPVFFATKNGRRLWTSEYGAYCPKNEQENHKGLYLESNGLLTIQCTINGILVNGSPKTIFISPRKGVLDFTAGIAIASEEKSVFVYQGSAKMAQSNGVSRFGSIEIDKYNANAKLMSRASLANFAPPTD